MFHDEFKNIELLKEEYEITDSDLKGVQILYAAYRLGNCGGDSIVLFKKNGKFFIVDASHCSCNGLAGQWSPVETNEKSLKIEINAKSNENFDEFQSFIQFCNEYFQWRDK